MKMKKVVASMNCKFILMISLFFSPYVIAQQQTDINQKKSGSEMSERSIVILGASYAKGWKPNELYGYKVINKGIGGNESGEMLARFGVDVLELTPKAVIIWGFINDIFRSQPGELEQKIDHAKTNITEMVNMAEKAGITPILATEVTITTPGGFKEWLMGIIGGILGKESYADRVNQHVIEINKWMRALAAERNISILDFEKVLADKKGQRKREFALDDGSHLTDKAYSELNNYIDKQDIKI